MSIAFPNFTCVVTCFLLAQTLHAEQAIKDAIYSGKICQSNVTLVLRKPETRGAVNGSYFYNSHCLDIPFQGSQNGNILTIHAGSFLREEADQERFDLKITGTSISGIWKYKGKTLAVSLKQTRYDAKKDPYSGNPFLTNQDFSNDYEQLRISKALLTPLDSIETLLSGIEIQWYKEQHWESYVFRVVKGLPEPTLKWVNNYLEYLQIMDFSHRGMCSYGEASEYDCSILNLFINQDFMAFNQFTGYYCGGAHPDFSSSQHNLDLKNKRVLTTEDLLQFAENTPSEENYDEWSIYRSEVFAPTIMDFMKQEHPQEMDLSMVNDEECDYNDPGIWQLSDVLITENGLWFSAYFYRAARSCDDPDWSVISYKRLSENLNPLYKNALLSLEK